MRYDTYLINGDSMAYEETVIDGVLSWRDAELNPEWNAFSQEALTAALLDAQGAGDALDEANTILESEMNKLRLEIDELRRAPEKERFPGAPWPFVQPPPFGPSYPIPMPGPVWVSPNTATPPFPPTVITCGTPPAGAEYRGTPETWGHNPLLRPDGCDC